MKKSLAAAIALITANIAVAGITYQPNDLNTFVNTAQCPNCDLSGLSDLILIMLMTNMAQETNNPNFYVGSNLQNANVIDTSFQPIPGYNYSNMQNSNFTSSAGSNANFTYVQLDGSSFVNAILEGTNFQGADLSNVDFSGADLKGANFDSANLYNAKITSEQLSEVSLCYAILPNGTNSTSCTGSN